MQKLIKIIFTFGFFLSLAACSYLVRNDDGYTPFDAREPGAISNRSQMLSNQVYRVNGRTYRVLASSKNYEERGTASWYGRRFNHRRTVSGERYNMHLMTAAHKTLPLSTKVVVTNLLNGKQVIVRVNDRGPFVGDRLIDLSFGAAKKLGMVGHGVVPVNVKALA